MDKCCPSDVSCILSGIGWSVGIIRKIQLSISWQFDWILLTEGHCVQDLGIGRSISSSSSDSFLMFFLFFFMFFVFLIWSTLFFSCCLGTHFRGGHFWFRSTIPVPNQVGTSASDRLSYSDQFRMSKVREHAYKQPYLEIIYGGSGERGK